MDWLIISPLRVWVTVFGSQRHLTRPARAGAVLGSYDDSLITMGTDGRIALDLTLPYHGNGFAIAGYASAVAGIGSDQDGEWRVHGGFTGSIDSIPTGFVGSGTTSQSNGLSGPTLRFHFRHARTQVARSHHPKFRAWVCGATPME